MLEFRPLSLSDRDIFRRHMSGYPFKTYEYSFATLYLWRRYCDAQIHVLEESVSNSALLIRKTCKFTGTYFMQPAGCSEKDLPRIIECLVRSKQNTPGMRYLFGDVEEAFLQQLIALYAERLKYSAHVENFDYIYKGSDLIELAGRRFHSKKNHVNRFLREYDHQIKDIGDSEIIEDCLSFSEQWFAQREDTAQLVAERAGIRDVLKNLGYLGLEGMAVYVDDQIVGFTLGEKVNDEMAVIHVEKADPAYYGVYAFINKAFVERYFASVRYINREEDLGLEGLRKAKMSYNPIKLEKKYLVNLD